MVWISIPVVSLKKIFLCAVFTSLDYAATSIPQCYRAAMVHGFVEELVVNEDPEYQWIDRIRTPRASNEARQRLISLMSGTDKWLLAGWPLLPASYIIVFMYLSSLALLPGELQRKIGLKVLEMGGNAVVGYLQCFDLEGESGLVVRAIGTACTLEKLSSGSVPGTATHTHPNTAPASNACNSPSKDGKEWVWTSCACSFCPGKSSCVCGLIKMMIVCWSVHEERSMRGLASLNAHFS